VFQVAVSVVLLSLTGTFVQMLLAARAQDTGYAVEGVAILETDARYAGYSGTEVSRVYEELHRRIETIPGVQAATLIGDEPMTTTGLGVIVEGQDANVPVLANGIWAGPRFFETMRIPVLFGRALDERDRAGALRVAVVNETMARHYFGTVNAVGRRFRIDQDPNWIEIAGVVRDTRTADSGGDLVDPTPYLFYRSTAQWNRPASTIVARTSLDAGSLVAAMQRELRAVDSALPTITARTMRQQLESSLNQPRAIATFLGGLGTLGMSLAGIGLYAVVAFAVSRRAREIGIRMALGAHSRQVVWSVAREVTALVGVGTSAGIGVSLLIVLAIRAFSTPAPGIALYQPSADPLSLLAIISFMIIVGVAAAAIPAWRAARMDPLSALRHE
jgi:predicted permease